MKTFSDILHSNDLKTFSFVFFNLGNKVENQGQNDEFDMTVEYRVSKFSNMVFDQDIADFNNDLLIDYTNLPFNVVTLTEKTIKHRIVLKNDTNFSRQEFLYQLYARIEQTRFSHTNRSFEKIIVSSFFIPRGSVDLNRNYFTVDVLRQNVSEEYIANLLSILMSLRDIEQLNFNFRELQPEYLDGKNRNTQLRINLRWFYDQYIHQLKDLNTYKYDLLFSNRDQIELASYNSNLASSFIERAIFYKDKVLGQQDDFENLSTIEIRKVVKKYRNELEFDVEPSTADTVSRDRSIIKLAIISQPDICHSCHNLHPLEDRTFTIRGTDRPYLEIHHVVSFGADNSGDVIENLVKLCPACHRALTPNRADEEYQKSIIENILDNSSDAFNYVQVLHNKPITKDDAIHFVYRNLM